ncbi:pentraxin fusion protein-like [Malaclemys terrapin pileata]|uniref:pentraxin fusion protein-like n=1 Tax=Malaclemys terrapin pileata TaxID=2991368 RepID=UPI0023A878B5|nr:pentraxin fusion protein-like [Malaclemys terrapin pileata]
MLHILSLLLILALKGLSTDEVPEVVLEGVASQSSIYDKYGNPGNAIDGSPSSDYLRGKCSHTDLDINPWWTLDLRARVQVFRVKITNRGDCCEERLNGAEIRIGSSPERGGRTNPRCAHIDSMGRGETHSFDCEGMQGQYVTVTIPGTEKYLTLCEVQVFGLPVNSSDLMLNETLGPRIPNGDRFETDIWITLNNSRAAPNVALGKTASQSSAGEIEDNPMRAIDGSLLNRSPTQQCSQTRRDFQPWWTVDLNATFIVSSVVITNRGDCCKERINGAEIRIGNSPELGGTLNPRCATVESMELGQTLSFDCHGMQGRYVTVTIPRRAEYLTLCEVQVFGLPLIFPGETLRAQKTTTGVPNVAPHGIASQSSIYMYSYTAQNANDGSLSADVLMGQCTHTRKEWSPWWRLDLKSEHKIFSVALTNRGDCCKSRINSAEIRIGNSNERGGIKNPRCGTVFRMDYEETLSFDCEGMQGRYVTVTIPGRAEYLSLCEVQVFGLPVSPLTSTTDFPLPSKGRKGSRLLGKAFIFPEETDTSYVVLSPAQPLSLGAFTLCMKVASELPPNREIILFSYRTTYYDELNVWQEFNGTFSLYLSGPGVHFTLPKLNTFGSHMCVTWESKSGLTAFWVNGERSLRKVLRPGHRIQPQGIVMLGQDPDTFWGSFEKAQSFVGEISDLYMWDHVLSPSIIQNVYLDHSFPKGNIFDWKSLSYKCTGNVIVPSKL